MMDYYYNQGSMGGGIFGMLLSLLVLAALVVGIIALVRFMSNSSAGSTIASRSAEDILKERYAKGEITKAEFDEIKKGLKD